MSDIPKNDKKESNNTYKLFAVLIFLIVIAVFIQSIYIHRLANQIRHLTEKQTPIKIIKKEKLPVFVKQKTKTDSSVKKTSSSKDNYLNKQLMNLLNSIDFSENNLSFNNPSTTSSKITKDHDKYIVTFFVHGINKKDISIEAINNVLTVGITTDTNISQQQNYSEYTESMLIPTDVNTSKITSKYENGVLTITLPRLHINPAGTRAIKVE